MSKIYCIKIFFCLCATVFINGCSLDNNTSSNVDQNINEAVADSNISSISNSNDSENNNISANNTDTDNQENNDQSSSESSSNVQNIAPTVSSLLKAAIEQVSHGEGLTAFMLPETQDYKDFPADPNNPITLEKVQLGMLLFHDTGFATKAIEKHRNGTYSCASCHHARAGFKSGIAQGIGEGGSGFGIAGELRTFALDDKDQIINPDVQPVASPSILNSAYQDVMLWNGQFGNAINGIINSGIDESILMTPNTPKVVNAREFSGLETQAIAGLSVHRMNVENDSILQTHPHYKIFFDRAFPYSNDNLRDAGKAIAAFERTVVASQAPFQKWLKGDESAMTENQKYGALLFFGKAGCVGCHTGPALSSSVGVTDAQVFFAIGFADLDINSHNIHGDVPDNVRLGRGGFTGNSDDNYKFKIPQLYNLSDAAFLGHGASFNSVKDVISYKNAAVAQNISAISQLDYRFKPLGLTERDIILLTDFIENGLYDNNLARYVPLKVPSGQCFPANDEKTKKDLNCE